MKEDESDAYAARRLYDTLKACEAGTNAHGPYWRSSELVAALRAFYKDMEEEWTTN